MFKINTQNPVPREYLYHLFLRDFSIFREENDHDDLKHLIFSVTQKLFTNTQECTFVTRYKRNSVFCMCECDFQSTRKSPFFLLVPLMIQSAAVQQRG